MALVSLLANVVNMPINVYVSITLLFALAISNIAVMELVKIIKRYKEPKSIWQEIIITIISFVTIFNFMYLENMYFVECIVMAMSVLLYIKSADLLVEKNKHYFIKSLVLSLIGVFCYQGTLSVLIAFTALFTILKNNGNIKKIILDIIKCGCIVVITVIVNLLAVKLLGKFFDLNQTRLGSLSDIISNIQYIIERVILILQTTCYLFPQKLMIAFLDILTLIIIIYVIRNKETRVLYEYITIAIITILVSSSTFIITLSAFNAGRLRFALGALIGIIFIFLYVRTNMIDQKSKLKIIPILLLISYFIITIVNYEFIMIEHKKVNQLEEAEAKKIIDYVENYEKENNVKVTKIFNISVNNWRIGYFPETKIKNVVTQDSLKTYWGTYTTIKVYTNRELTIETDREKLIRALEKLDRNLEYQCVEDVLYIKTYIL